MAIIGKNCFMGVRYISESIVECFDGTPKFGWIGLEVYFTEGVFPEGEFFLFDVIVYFTVRNLLSFG